MYRPFDILMPEVTLSTGPFKKVFLMPSFALDRLKPSMLSASQRGYDVSLFIDEQLGFVRVIRWICWWIDEESVRLAGRGRGAADGPAGNGCGRSIVCKRGIWLRESKSKTQ